MVIKRIMPLAAALLASTAPFGPGARAQTAQPAPAQADIAPAEIIVTAQRRQERLIDVPVAVSAITDADIANRNVTSLSDLQAAIPALRIVDIGPGSQRIQLRGISQYQGLPTVGNYIDEFSINPYAASGVAEVPLLDLERVEVLRGPQAVLYGDSSMGGTIRYITANPNLTGYSGALLGEVSVPSGGEAGGRMQGMLNLPIVNDRVGLRVAGSFERQGGYIDGPTGRNANAHDITSVRAKLLLKTSSRLTINLLGQYNETGQDVKSYSDAHYHTAQLVPSIARQRYVLGTAQVAYDLDFATLASITGYLGQSGRSVDDSAHFYNTLFGAPLLRTAVTDARSELEKFSQEVRLTSNGKGRLRWLLGAIYVDYVDRSTIPGDGESLIPGLPASALGVVFDSTARSTSRNYSVYGQASFDITRWLTLDAGARYFNDRRTTQGVFTLIGFPFPPTITDARGTFDTVNPRVSLTGKTGDGIVYVSAAKGFRSGGFNQVTNPIIPPTFGPEKLWTYEAGAKQSLLDRKLIVELAVYWQDYSGIQANQLINPTVATVTNSGSASGPGVDFSLRATPVRDLSLFGALGYNGLRYDSTTTDRLKGEPADLVPDWSASVAVDYTPRLTERLRLLAHVDVNYTDKARITLRSPTFNQVAFTEVRKLANLRFGVTSKSVDVYGFVNNVTGEARIVNPAFGAFFEPIYTRPRTFGLGVSSRW